MIIKLAVRSWIPGLPSESDETLDDSPNEEIIDQTDFEAT